jgi:HlyD family secretion protein
MAHLALSFGENKDAAAANRIALSDWAAVVKEEEAHGASLRGPIMLGIFTLIVGVGGFFLWAGSTELSSAAIASGRVIVESSTKTVSHLEGGTLRALVVREGDKVKAGEVLARLDATRSESALLQLKQQQFADKAQLARLVAERNGSEAFSYETQVPEGMDTTAAGDVLLTERRLFIERTSLFRDQIAADESGIAQLASQRQAIEARRRSWVEQEAVVRREVDTYTKLQARKLITAAAFNAKYLQLLDLTSRIGESDAVLAENSQRKRQLELSVANRRNDYFRGVSVEIQQTQTNIVHVRQQIISAEDVVAKAAIRAPQDGIIANIRIRTPGSALTAGSPVLDIVPANQPMLIEGVAAARDIDQMRVGQKAEIKLSAFGAAELRPLVGHVTYIAPDSTIDERTGDVRFAFRAKIDEAELKAQPNLFLYPGMPAEVYIVTGDRTALAYLTEPIRRSFSRAFREQ